MTTTLYQASDLAGRKRREFLDQAKTAGKAQLRDTDGTPLVLLTGRALETLEHSRSAVALLLNLLAIESHGDTARPADMGELAWLSAFDAEDRAAFHNEFLDTLAVAVASDDFTGVDKCLDDWKRTARALSEPTRKLILTGAGDDKYVEVEAPTG